MSDFVATFPGRTDAAQALKRALSDAIDAFAPADPRQWASRRPQPTAGPTSFSPQPGPRHFTPADPAADPTAGWNPLDPQGGDGEPSFVDPVAAAHAAGYAEGLAMMTEATTAAAERDRALLIAIAEGLRSGIAIDRERMASQLRQTVMFLVGKLVGEIGISPERLAERIAAATDLLADANESAMLRVHPDDVALLDGRLPTSVFAVGDASVTRGGFVLESASTIVEDGPALWLDQLALAVDRVAVPDLVPPQC